MNVFSYWWDCCKARMRGERRTHGRNVKGRVYQKAHSTSDIAKMVASGQFDGKIRPTGIYIASEDQWYDLDKEGNRTPRMPSHRRITRR